MFIVLRDELTYIQVSMIYLKHNRNDAENMTVQGKKNLIWFEGWCGGGWIQGDTDSRRLGFFFFSHLVLTIVLCLLNKLMEFLLSVRNAAAKHWVGIRGLGSGLGSTLAICGLAMSLLVKIILEEDWGQIPAHHFPVEKEHGFSFQWERNKIKDFFQNPILKLLVNFLFVKSPFPNFLWHFKKYWNFLKRVGMALAWFFFFAKLKAEWMFWRDWKWGVESKLTFKNSLGPVRWLMPRIKHLGGQEEDHCKLKANLEYMLNSRPTWPIKWGPVSTKSNKGK